MSLHELPLQFKHGLIVQQGLKAALAAMAIRLVVVRMPIAVAMVTLRLSSLRLWITSVSLIVANR
jgi:hypothetical protein